MRRYEPKTRYKLSETQELLLHLVLKYRFVSSDLLASCLNKDRSTIYERLSVLVNQGYLVKLYDSSYRIRQRPAIYHLDSGGIRYLKKAGLTRAQLHYKNKYFTDEQIDEQMLLTKLARTARRPYENKLDLYTKYQLGANHFYLSPPPYAKLIGKDDTTPDYLLEYFPTYHQTWKIRKRINQHINYADENDEYTYPHLLLVCSNQSTEQRAVSMTRSLLNDFDIFTTTKDRLLSGDKEIWLKPDEVDWDEELKFYELPVEFEE